MKKLNIKTTMLACSAGLFLAACSSTHDEQSHVPYSTTGESQQDGSWIRGSSQHGASDYSAAPSASASRSSPDQNNIVIPLHEEQIKVGKRSVDAGQVTIRKVVTTRTVNEPIQLRSEELIIDRETSSAQSQASSADQNSINEPAGASNTGGAAFQEQTFTIRLQKEEPVIQKDVVQTGQVTARKDSQTQQQTVQQQIRKEDVQLDKSADVEIRGNFAEGEINEPAGAERPESIQNDSSESERLDSSRDESLDPDQQSRVPTKGLGAEDLKNQPEE